MSCRKSVGKIVAMFILAVGALCSEPILAWADTPVKVTLPTFQVTLNGTPVDNTNSQYPLLVYQDITYFPMTYHGARFLQVKANWYDNVQVLFVGKAEEKEAILQQEKASSPNKSSYTAVIPTYKIAVNTIRPSDFLDNSQEPYPLLNFRGITYFPLTWRFAAEEFGWDYHFDEADGLVINSGEMFRPVLEDGRIANTSPNRGMNELAYYYGEAYYVGYPVNTFNDNFTLVICKRGEAERIYSLKDTLNDSDYYFNQQYDKEGLSVEAVSEMAPAIEGDIFSVYCRRLSSEENVWLEIDLTSGRVIRQDVVSRS